MYRKRIGYTIGTINVLGGLQQFAQGNSSMGWLYVMLGGLLILDAWDNWMIKYIANRDNTIVYPWEPDLVEWLQENYPYSGYRVVELETA